MGPISSLGYLLQHVTAQLHRQADQLLQERLGIGMSQFKLLMMLQTVPGVQQRKLAECLSQTEASISRQTKLLQEKGLVIAAVNRANHRQHVMTITAKGVQITEAAHEALAAQLKTCLSQFSDKQVAQLIAMLSSVHDHVCAAGRPHACERPFNI